jgi:hypothetical protein
MIMRVCEGDIKIEKLLKLLCKPAHLRQIPSNESGGGTCHRSFHPVTNVHFYHRGGRCRSRCERVLSCQGSRERCRSCNGGRPGRVHDVYDGSRFSGDRNILSQSSPRAATPALPKRTFARNQAQMPMTMLYATSLTASLSGASFRRRRRKLQD